MKLLEEANAKPNQFCTSGVSPPQLAIPPQLAEELAEILAEALVADLSNTEEH